MHSKGKRKTLEQTFAWLIFNLSTTVSNTHSINQTRESWHYTHAMKQHTFTDLDIGFQSDSLSQAI